MWSFKKYREECVKTYSKDVEKEEIEEETVEEETMHEEEMKVENWVWVEGFKGTDKDMKCRDFQYELGKQYDMPEGENIVECQSGFHLCLKLSHVFKYYDFCNDNRFFKVMALVREEDLRNYYPGRSTYGFTTRGNPKLAAKSIIFTQELTLDELCLNFGIQDWPEDKKKLACTLGIREVECMMRAEHLVM